jgi:hypothetical protein
VIHPPNCGFVSQGRLRFIENNPLFQPDHPNVDLSGQIPEKYFWMFGKPKKKK